MRRRRPAARRPVAAIESLEPRLLLTTLTVNSLDDFSTVPPMGDGIVTLREAINAANGDTTTDLGQTGSGADDIVFDPSLAGGTITLAGGDFTLTTDITITGFGIGGLTIDAGGASRIFTIFPQGPTPVVGLTGLTLTNGADLSAGAVSNSGTLTVADSIFQGNAAQGGSPGTSLGGAIYNDGQLTVQDGRFTANTSEAGGGAIYNAGTATIEFVDFDANTAGGDGGAIVNQANSVMALTGGVIQNNVAGNGGAGSGGAVFNAGGLTVLESIIKANTAAQGGGAIDNRDVLTVDRGEFTGNFAAIGAGVNNFGQFTFVNGTLSGNSASGGGGALHNDGTTVFRNATLTGNRADDDGLNGGVGGGVLTGSLTSFVTTLFNTIVAGNFVGTGTAANDLDGAPVDSASINNLIGDAATAGGLTDGVNGNIVGVAVASVLDTILRDNGGATQTHALVAGSRAIDAGANAEALDANGNPLAFDQRGSGFPRILGGSVDIGAFEFDVPTVSVEVAPAAVAEDGAANLVYTFTRTGGTAAALTVNYTVDGSATEGSDYALFGGNTRQAVFAAGAATATVTADPTADAVVEPNETVVLTVAAGAGYTASGPDGSATGTIVNDDPSGAATVGVRVSPSRVLEDGPTNLTYTFTRTGSMAAALTVRYAVSGTAVEGRDYALSGATRQVTFAAGSATATVTADPTTDGTVEADETVVLTVAAGTGYVVSGPAATATGVIVNDEAATIRVSNAAVLEGADGQGRFLQFTISLDKPVDAPVAVTYLTFDGSARAGRDYRRTGGRVTFNPGGSRTRQIRVPVFGDDLVERNETMSLRLSNLGNPAGRAVALGRSGVGTIVNDDAAIIRVSDAAVAEGADGQGRFLQFTITLDKPVDAPVAVTYLTFDGSARAGRDYRRTGGRTTFNPGGSRTRQIRVPVFGDDLVERNETLSLRLSNLGNPAGRAVAIGRSGVGTIVNDDAATISVSAASVTEAADGQTRFLDFTITLDKPVETAVSVTYLTFDGSARAGRDYRRTGGRTTFNPGGSRTRLIRVAVFGDDVVERNETLSLRLSNLGNPSRRAVAIGGSGVGTIVNDDAALLSVSPASVAVSEGPRGRTVYLDFDVSLDKAVDVPVSATYITADGAGRTGARAGSDFRRTGGRTTFNPGGSLTRRVRVAVYGDDLPEANETMSLTLSNLSGLQGRAVALGRSGVGRILDDDSAAVSVGDARVAEGKPGQRRFLEFEIGLSRPVTTPVTARYLTFDRTAVAGSDYARTGGSVTFNPGGSRTRKVRVELFEDETVEMSETMELRITGLTGSRVDPPRIEKGTGVGTIVNDDAARIRVSKAAIREGAAGGSRRLEFSVVMTRPSDAPVTFIYQDAGNGSAVAGVDYVAFPPGSVTLAPGQTRTRFGVALIGDDVVERDETIRLRNGVVAGGRQVVLDTGVTDRAGTIVNDDLATVSVSNARVTEGDAGGTAMLDFAVTLSKPVDAPVSVRYATSNGTAPESARADVDYTAASGTLLFAPGERTKKVQVAVAGDGLYERNEVMNLNLSGLTASGRAVTLGRAQGVGTIVNDDPRPVVGVDIFHDKVAEDGQANLVFDFRRTVNTVGSLNVFFRLGGSATFGTDYQVAGARSLGDGAFLATFASRASVVRVTVDPTPDTLVEENPETDFGETVEAAPAAGRFEYAVDPNAATAVGTIRDDDSAEARARLFSDGLADALV